MKRSTVRNYVGHLICSQIVIFWHHRCFYNMLVMLNNGCKAGEYILTLVPVFGPNIALSHLDSHVGPTFTVHILYTTLFDM